MELFTIRHARDSHGSRMPTPTQRNMKTLKKAFSSFVSFTTILWSVGGTLAFPSVASAATLNSGDLIKASGPAVYYYAADGKRYVFPNEKTYFTWYSDFSSVVTITDAELAAISIGGNVTYRPGVKMIKITTDPKVYAVSMGGELRHVPSEACAITLYGANWNTMIEDVPDGFFVNYTVGSPIAADCSDYDKAAEMAASPTINTDLGATSSPVSSGAVSAALASDTPAGATVPKNASSVALFKTNLSAGAQAATVTGLKLRRLGVGATTDFSNVYLYDGNGNRLTTGRTINSSSNIVEFNGLNLNIPANSTVSVVLTGDFSAPATTGGQHAFELTDASAVVSGGSVSGSFPVRGNTFTVGTIEAGELDVTKSTTPTNPAVGSQDVEISNFKLTANTNDIEVRRVTLLQAGGISNSDLTDLKLWQGSTQVASVAALSSDKIVLNFNPPFVLEDGQTRTFSLTADVAGRSDRTIRTYVEYTTDVYAMDKLYNAGAAVDISGFDGGSASEYVEVTTEGGQLTVAFNGPTTGNVSKGSQDAVLYRFSLTSSESDLDIRRLRFRLESTDNGLVRDASTAFFTDIKVVDTDTDTTVMGPTSLGSGAIATSTFALNETFQLPANSTRNLAIVADIANSTDSDLIDHQFRVCLSNADAADECTTGNIFAEGDVKVVETNENLALTEIVPNTAIAGNNFTVKSADLSVALAASPSAGTAVKKQADIPAVGFVFTSGEQSSAMIRSVKFTGRGNLGSYALADLIDVVTSCSLYDGATKVGNTQSPDATSGEFTITNINTTVPAGDSKTLVVKCTADSQVDGAEDTFAIGIASVNDITAEDDDNNDVTPSLSSDVIANAGATPVIAQTVKAGGTLSITPGSQPTSDIVVAGGWQKFAEYEATAQFEAINLERISVTSTGDAANFTSVAVRVAGADKGASVLPSGAAQAKDIDLVGSNKIMVPKDSSVTFELWGQLAATKSSSSVSGATSGVPRSGNTAALGLNAAVTTGNWSTGSYGSAFNVRALGQASGDLLYAAGASASMGNSQTVYKTVPTITKLAVSTATMQSGANMELFKFQVTPDAAGAVSWIQTKFTVTTSTGVSLGNFQFFKGSTQLTANTEVKIEDGAGNDLTGGTLGTNPTVVVKLVNEETVSGSGTTYTLRATPSFSGTGNSVSTKLVSSGQSSAIGYLALPAGTPAYGIDTDTAFDNTINTTGSFIWSDRSEVPHSSATTTPSQDWINDAFLDDLTQTQVLSN